MVELLGVISVVLLSGINLAHLLFTVGITMEQIKTGWGFGTNWDLLALMPWLLESAGVAVMILALVFLLLSRKKRLLRNWRIGCGVLLGVFFLQTALTNLFFWM